MQVIGFTQAVPLNADVELHPHIPGFGVLLTNEVLHLVQNPVLLQAVQFEEQGMHLFEPSLYYPVGHTVAATQVPATIAYPVGHAHAPVVVSVRVGLQVVQVAEFEQLWQF